MLASNIIVKRISLLTHIHRSNPSLRTPYLFLARARSLHTTPTNMSLSDLPPFDPKPAHRWTRQPDASWRLGEGLKASESQLAEKWKEDESAGWKTLELDQMEKACVVHLIQSLLNSFLGQRRLQIPHFSCRSETYCVCIDLGRGWRGQSGSV